MSVKREPAPGFSQVGSIERAADAKGYAPHVETRTTARFRPWQIAIWVIVLGLLALLAWKLIDDQRAQATSGLAPDFTLHTFDGQEIRLSSLRGKVVVVNFWASWCKPCEDEAPDLERAWRTYRDRGVVFLGIDYVDTDSAAQAYLKRFDVTYPNGPDTQMRISAAYRTRGVPETFFIDREGRIVDVKFAPLTWDELTAKLDKLLAGSGG